MAQQQHSGASTCVTLSDRSGNQYKVHRVGGRNYTAYGTWTDDKDFSKLLDMVKNMEVRSDDVFLTGYQKSGNNWVFEVLSMLSHQQAEYAPGVIMDLHMDAASEEWFEQAKNKPSPRILYSHLNPDSLPAQIPEKGAKLIYLVRNIKDVAVSGFHFFTNIKTFVNYKGTWEDFLDVHVFGEGLFYGSWFDHVAQADVWKKNNPDKVYVLCYETLKLDTVEELKRLGQFLGFGDMTHHLAQDIADKVSFAKMRPTVMETKLKKFTEGNSNAGTPGLLRKGVVGDWKNHFTVEQNDRVERLMVERLSGSPIAEMVRPYMN